MSRTNRSRRPGRRGHRPGVEGLEARNLMSAAQGPRALVAQLAAQHRPAGLFREVRALPQAPAPPRIPHRPAAGLSLRLNNRLHVPDDLPPPVEAAKQAGLRQNPAPNLVLRGAWANAFPSFYVIGPPDFQGQVAKIVIEGYRETSYAENKGESINFLLNVPEDPGMPIMGTAIYVGPGDLPRDKLVMDVEAVSESTNPLLPTHLTFKVRPGASTGLFTGADGQGVMRLTYRVDPNAFDLIAPSVGPPTVQIPRGFPRRGHVGVYVSGLINLNPIFDKLVFDEGM